MKYLDFISLCQNAKGGFTMKQNLIFIALMLLCAAVSQSWGENHVLSLDGYGDYVRIPSAPQLQGGENLVKTIEAWFMLEKIPFPVVSKALDGNDKDWSINLNEEGQIQFFSEIGNSDYMPASVCVLPLNQWYHVAVVINRPQRLLRLYLNGVLVVEDTSMPNESAKTEAAVEIGALSYNNRFAAGYIDEVRIWNVARTEEQIRATMFTILPGNEPGLVGYWRFDDLGNIATDSSPNHSDGKLIGDAHFVEAELPKPGELIIPTVISGTITDEAGKLIANALVQLESVHEVTVRRQDGEEIAKTQANGSGNYSIVVYSPRGSYDLSVTSGEKGVWQLGIRLSEGERRNLNLTLKKAISISGTLLMLDDTTPHVACVVQAVRPPPNGEGEPTVIATTLTDENGKYQFINLKPATYQVRCYTLDGYVYHQQGKHLTVETGKSLTNIDFHFAPFKKGTWRTYTTFDGLPANLVDDIYQDAEGFMWFATWGGGVARYDGQGFENFTIDEGLVSNHVVDIYEATDGNLWFGTADGISRYNGKGFVNFTTEVGHQHVRCIHQDVHGRMWFGTLSGVSHYDGREFTTLTTDDGLASNQVASIGEDADGVLWFGTMGGVQRGVYPFDKLRAGSEERRDGESFVAVPQLGGGLVHAIHQARDGAMWFGTWLNGVFRYDGQKFVHFTTADGLAHSIVTAIYEAPDGNLWFGTGFPGSGGNGISRYDGENFVNFTTADGLVNNIVRAIYQDASGAMWFATSRGISQYEPMRVRSFTRQDGMAHNKINTIHRDADGTMWFGTDGGLCRYEDIPSGTRRDRVDFITVTSSGGGQKVRAIYGDISATPKSQSTVETLWLGTEDGVWQYDGTAVVPVLTGNDIGNNRVNDIERDASGNLWIATGNGAAWGSGVFRYDGTHLDNFTEKDGLAGDDVADIYRAADGTMWFGTDNGISRYANPNARLRLSDGMVFDNFTRQDKGWAYQVILCIYGAPDGRLWFGNQGDVSVYDGQQLVTLSSQIRLNQVNALYQATDGQMWFGTERGAVHYDKTAWAVLDTRDGLASNAVRAICEYENGALWFATDHGVTRYLPDRIAPKVRLISVRTDKVYTEFKRIPPITTGNRVTIKYSAVDFVTIPEKRQYRVKIGQSASEQMSQWTQPTKEATFDWTPDEPGDYTFAVQAIDRDLNYSEPASLTLNVVPPWYLNGWIAFPSGGGIIALLIGFIVFGSRYYIQRCESQRLREQMLQQEREARETLEAQNIQLQEAKETAEVAREEAETANQAKSIFLANMSHEIRTPMNAVLGYAQILQRDHELLQRQRDAVDTIENSGNHLLALINDVLDISKIEAGRLELQETDFDLKALIDGISAMFQMRCEREGLTWRAEGVTTSEERILVHGDDGKLRQILINLLGNAVKFTESGGVTLRVTPTSEARLDARLQSVTPNSDARLQSGKIPAEAGRPVESTSDARQSGKLPAEAGHPPTEAGRPVEFCFEVIDTGVGIPPEAQAKIFEPFQQSEEGAKKGGTGLGLTISQRYIALMGGELSLESEMGVGSNFFFTLTFGPATSDVIDQASRYSGVTHLAAGYDITALIADDTKVNRDVLSRMLSDLGVEVIEAENGQQAVEMFRSHKPDIVFMDIRMPVMDGLEAARLLFEEFDKNQLKIIAISASTLRHEQEEYFQAGFDDFIPKPFRFEQLCGCLASVLSVEYEYTDAVSDEQEEVPELDLTKVVLPEDLLSRLKEAAETYSLTELNQCFAEMEELGEDVRPLVDRLRELARNQDMEEILNILSEYQKS